MSIPSIFQNCSNLYSEKYQSFANCSSTDDPCSNLQQLHNIHNAIFYGMMLVPSIVSLIALILNIYIFVVTTKNFRKLHEDLQKRFIFLISKTISSILLSGGIISVSIATATTNLTFWSLSFFIFLNEFGYISCVGTYIGSTFSTYLAIVRPLLYRKYMTIKMTLIIAGINWLISAIFSAYISVAQAAYMIPIGSPFNCDYRNCFQPALIISTIEVCVTFIVTFTTLLFSIISLYRHLKRSEKLNDISNSETIPIILRRMISALIVLIFVAVFEVTIAFVITFNSLSSIIFNLQDICSLFYQSSEYLTFATVIAIFTNTWIFGIILDPVTVLLFDPLISKWPKKHIRQMTVILTVRRPKPLEDSKINEKNDS